MEELDKLRDTELQELYKQQLEDAKKYDEYQDALNNMTEDERKSYSENTVYEI